MKTCRFIIQERWFFGHGSWFNMQFRSEKTAYIQKKMQNLARSRHPTDVLHIFNLSTSTCIYTCNAHALMSAIVWTRLFSLLTPFFFTVFSRKFHVLLGSLLILLGSLLILLGSCSRKPHGYFTVVLLFPQQLKGSENSQCLLSLNERNHWIYGANLENNMLTSSRGLCSQKLLFFATEHGFSTHEPLIFMLSVIKNWSYILQKTKKSGILENMFGKPLLALPKLHFWGHSRTFGVVRKDPKNWGRGIPGKYDEKVHHTLWALSFFFLPYRFTMVWTCFWQQGTLWS